MRKQTLMTAAVAALGAFAITGTASAQSIIADFNESEVPFTWGPGDSGTSTNTDTDSTAELSTDGSLEGGQHQRLAIITDPTRNPTISFQRARHVAGGGSPANNTSFATDGFIGYYLKTTQEGLTTQIALDGPDGATANANGGTFQNIIADGEWHLYEWNLDDSSQWVAASGIGGGNGLSATATIDSVIIFNASQHASYTIDFDFVAHNPAGSVAALVPEPTSLAALGGLGLLSLRRRRA